ncbi:hypothetical protein TanjilG_22603 [Lupinus angustifolius]|uniref:RING-type domain-containing protein n=1 Tax=Lupinus angustifolius TaxID=3871 RepID=A0A4P1RT31_LUPAN|nr:PREDICTED: uncharacterized protein LOC109332416 isoform X2 [Lupinus angustifolius]OIW17491.1 hypothetical protein TanjilG_22603 [Lupinus angustifolius]
MVIGIGNNDDVVGDNESSFASVSCSICLDVVVVDNGDRSWANLQCGHRFHLDCIGSAFNVKGAMQCPNCRKIEKGKWLYANGCRSYPEFSLDDWTHDEDLYDLSYSEMSFGVHWCPFSNLTQLPSSFEEGEFSSTAYHEIVGQHTIFAEHTAVSPASDPCPYMAYIGPIHPSTSNPGVTVSEASNSNHWNGPPAHRRTPTTYTFPGMNIHYPSWEHHSSHLSSATGNLGAPADQTSVSPSSQRLAMGSGSFMHPFLVGHSSAARPGSLVTSAMIPPYPGSNAQTRNRVRALQPSYQTQQLPNSTTMRTPIAPGTRRTSSHSGSTQLAPVALSPDHGVGFLFVPSGSSGHHFQEETHLPSHFHAWERDQLPPLSFNHINRDPSWRAYQHGSDPGIRSSNFRLRHGVERMPSQNL